MMPSWLVFPEHPAGGLSTGHGPMRSAEGRSKVHVPGPGSPSVGAAEIEKLSGAKIRACSPHSAPDSWTAPVGRSAPHDLAGELLELLLSRQRVENASWSIAAFENLVKVIRNLIELPSRDVSQLEFAQVNDALQEARRRMVDERERYRDGSETLKVDLGLARSTPITLGTEVHAGFRKTYEALDRWCMNPEREWSDLPEFAFSLPVLEDLAIDGRSVANSVEHPDQLEDLLSAAVGIARKRQTRRAADPSKVSKADATSLELKVRREIRRLIRIRTDYQIERRRFELLIRRREQAQEPLLGPRPIILLETNPTPRKGAG